MFRVVSYNILAESFVRHHERSAGVDAAARRARLLEEIASFDADVLALQEVESDMFAALQKRLGSSYQSVHALRKGSPDGSAIFSRGGITTSEELHFDLGKRGKGRLSLLATTTLDGASVGIVSTHLQWQGSETPAERHLGRQQLIELLDTLDASIPWIVCGDFNANSTSSVLQAAYDRGWELSCRTQRPWDTTNINGRRRKIDYLLIKPSSLSPTPGRMPKLERNTPLPSLDHPSDHLPVQVDFSLR
jgi:endonuclease/exonuclease/phosphatase family metal-dependent hydrolase